MTPRYLTPPPPPWRLRLRWLVAQSKAFAGIPVHWVRVLASMRRPNDPERWSERGCDAYWGSHGCALERGHRGPHVCGDSYRVEQAGGVRLEFYECCRHDGDRSVLWDGDHLWRRYPPGWGADIANARRLGARWGRWVGNR